MGIFRKSKKMRLGYPFRGFPLSRLGIACAYTALHSVWYRRSLVRSTLLFSLLWWVWLLFLAEGKIILN